MKKSTFISAILLMTFLVSCSYNHNNKKQVSVIFDSDMGPDYDDVGALTILHALAHESYVDILATIASNKYELTAPCMDVINTYYEKHEIPVGAAKTDGVNIGCWQKWADTLVAVYPHKILKNDDATDARLLYRKILNSQPDSSVIIITVGYLTNLKDLLQTPPDTISNLNGFDLVKKKVKVLVSMAGKFPEGKEWNLWKDSSASVYVYEKWPVKVIFTGWEIGSAIHTGLKVAQANIKSPAHNVFRIAIPMAEEDKKGRMSWDETAVLIGVFGPEKYFNLQKGRIIVQPDGSNKWEKDINGPQEYVTWKLSADSLGRIIDNYMSYVPVKQ